jgi:hypothetical protein
VSIVAWTEKTTMARSHDEIVKVVARDKLRASIPLVGFHLNRDRSKAFSDQVREEIRMVPEKGDCLWRKSPPLSFGRVTNYAKE